MWDVEPLAFYLLPHIKRNSIGAIVTFDSRGVSGADADADADAATPTSIASITAVATLPAINPLHVSATNTYSNVLSMLL